jgi:hypothetical protein
VTTTTRRSPRIARSPWNTDRKGLYARNIECEGKGATSSPTNPYSYAQITVEFRTPDQDFSDSAWSTKRLRFSANAVTLPGVPFKWPSDNRRVNQDIAILVPQVELSYVRFWVADIDRISEVIYGLVGRVNNATFLGQPAASWLFAGANTEVQNTIGGSRSNQVELALIFNPVGWQSVLRDDTGLWEAVVKPDGSGPYEVADFSPLLTL